ncbi:MAG TPA: hypothetical protein VFD89_01310 [Clostridia bacterium]|nr:hypothetical protein [Clostridia bacterium]
MNNIGNIGYINGSGNTAAAKHLFDLAKNRKAPFRSTASSLGYHRDINVRGQGSINRATSVQWYYNLNLKTPTNSNTASGVIDLLKMENIRKVNNLKELELDWNGNGGLPFSNDSIFFFRDIIEHIIKQPNIAPTGRESLLMQYELEDRSFLGFEVFKGKVDKVLIPQRDYNRAVEEEITNDYIVQINKSVESFYGYELH